MLDQLDIALIAELQEHGRASVAELARKLKKPRATVRDRLRRLEHTGAIEGYTAVIDMATIGFPIKALVQVSTSGQAVDPAEFLRQVGQIPEVLSADLITGDFEALVTVCVRDIEHLSRVLYEDMRQIPGVTGTNTSIVLLGRQWKIPR